MEHRIVRIAARKTIYKEQVSQAYSSILRALCLCRRRRRRRCLQWYREPALIHTFWHSCFVLTASGTAAAQAAAIAAAEVHGTGRKKGAERVHESRWKVAADAAANASRYGEARRGAARDLVAERERGFLWDHACRCMCVRKRR